MRSIAQQGEAAPMPRVDGEGRGGNAAGWSAIEQQRGSHQRGRRRVGHCPALILLHRFIGTRGSPRLPVRYTIPFAVVVLFVFVGFVLWLSHFTLAPPGIFNSHEDCWCSSKDDHLRQTSVGLLACFACFAVVRVPAFLPGVAARVARIRAQESGRTRQIILHVLLQGPLYMLAVGSVLFFFQLILLPRCESCAESFALRQKMERHAAFACSICIACCVLAFMHGQILDRSLRSQCEKSRGAPKGTVEGLPTYTYDPEIFGGEDGKQYPGECPICLQEWGQGDVIKITRCGHAFHQTCIAYWLQKERTCPYCRQDVVNTAGQHRPRPTPCTEANIVGGQHRPRPSPQANIVWI